MAACMAARGSLPATLALLALAAPLLAGCLAQPAPVAPAAAAVRPPALAAPGARLSQAGDAARAVWTGTVDPLRGALEVDVRWPVPEVTGAYAELPFTLPPEATTVEGALRWTGAPGFLGFGIVNASGSLWCGQLPGARDNATCLAPVPTARAAGEAWNVVLIGDALQAPPAQPVPYEFTLAVRAAPLPRFGSPAPSGEGAPLRFAAPVLVDSDQPAVEPSIAVTPRGDVYVAALTGQPGGLWRAPAGGAFERVQLPLAQCTSLGELQLPPLLAARGAGPGFTHVGCGDTDVAAAGDKDAYFTWHWGDEGVAGTHDGGQTWSTQLLGTGPELHTDRQWLATNGPGEAWLAYDGMTTYAGLGSYVARTVDGGLTWLNLGKVLGNTQCVTGLGRSPGPEVVLYVVGCDDKGPGIAVSRDHGLTFDWHAIAPKPVTDFFVKVAVDAAGTVYAAWTEPVPHGTAVLVAHSRDQGTTWSQPQRVSPPDGTYVYPWMTGGAAGHVAVAFYGTRAPSEAPERVVGDWYPMVAESADADQPDPGWRLAAVSDHAVQYGGICLGGNGCAQGRNLGDFFQVQADAGGMLHVAYVDSGAGAGGVPQPDRAYARAAYAREVAGLTLGGPSVEKDGGATAAR